MYILEEIASAPPPLRLEVQGRALVMIGTRTDRHAHIDAELVILGDDTVTSGSNGHCRIWEEGGRLYVQDNGSDNGTWLGVAGSSRVKEFTATELGEGMVLRVGRRTFRVRSS